MDTFPFDSWEEALADGGAFFTWAGSQGMINLLTLLGAAAFVLSLIHLIRSENSHLTSAARDLAGSSAGASADFSAGSDTGGE